MHSRCSALLLLLAACPGDDTTGSGSTTATTTAVTTTATTAATMSDPTSTGSSADGSDDGDDDGSGCPAFEDATASAITIELVNMRAEGVWLPMSPDCIDPVPFLLEDPDGAPAAWRAPACGTCEGAVQGDCPCPPPFCDEVTALYLEAGATVQYSWSGVVYVEETVPDACPGIHIAACGTQCQRAITPAAGDYTFTIGAGSASGCAVEPCDCMPSDGSCTLLDPGMSFDGLVDVVATLSLPGESSVQLAIR